VLGVRLPPGLPFFHFYGFSKNRSIKALDMKNIGTFFKEVRVELSKIVWPTREEFIGATVVALIVILAFTLFLTVINYVFNFGAQRVLAALIFNVR